VAVVLEAVHPEEDLVVEDLVVASVVADFLAEEVAEVGKNR
jgi:hypothetical protein